MSHKRIVYLLFIVLIALLFYVLYKYSVFKNHFENEQLPLLSAELSIEVINYASEFDNKDFSIESNFKELIMEINQSTNILSDYSDLLNDCYGLKYDENSKYFLFFLCGEDNKQSLKNYSIENIDSKKIFSQPKPDFLSYLFSNSDYDIILFGYKKPTSKME